MDYFIDYFENIEPFALFVTAVVATVSLAISARGTRRQAKLSIFENLRDIHNTEIKLRPLLAKYKPELDALMMFIKNNSCANKRGDFVEEFSNEKYRNLRKLVYFYEYLGTTLKYKAVDFNPLFSLVNFPDNLYSNTAELRNHVRNIVGIPDFLVHFDDLYFVYMKRRKRNSKIENVVKQVDNVFRRHL